MSGAPVGPRVKNDIPPDRMQFGRFGVSRVRSHPLFCYVGSPIFSGGASLTVADMVGGEEEVRLIVLSATRPRGDRKPPVREELGITFLVPDTVVEKAFSTNSLQKIYAVAGGVPIPDNPALLGAMVYTQVVMLGSRDGDVAITDVCGLRVQETTLLDSTFDFNENRWQRADESFQRTTKPTQEATREVIERVLNAKKGGR